MADATQGQHGVSYSGQLLRSVAGADAAFVLGEGLVADPVQPVLDAPVGAIQRQQPSRIGFCTRERGDAVHDLRRGLQCAGLAVALCAAAGDAEDLPHAGPAELLFQKVIQRNRAFERAMLAPAVALVRLSMRLAFGFTLPLLVGGKRPRFVR